MLKLKEIVAIVNKKVDHTLQSLAKRLTDRVGSQIIKNNKIQQLRNDYLHDSLPAINGASNKLRPIQIKQRNSQNKSQSSLKQNRGNKLVRNSASIAGHHIERQLHKKREILMGEIRQIEHKIKNQHAESLMQKLKRNKTQAEIDWQSHEKAAKLVQKMNIQRKQIMQKKTKEALTLQKTVQQTLKKFKQMEQLKKQQLLKKKLQIEKRIENRKYKALQRDRLNKMSNQIIKELNSYKISLPDIYHKQHSTVQEASNKQQPQVMLTNIRNDMDTLQNDKSSIAVIRESRVSSFLNHVRLEQEERKRLSQKKKEYPKNVRDKQLEFGKKVRYQQKIKSDRKNSNSKNKLIHRKLVIAERPILKPQQDQQNSFDEHNSSEELKLSEDYKPSEEHLTEVFSEK